MASILATDEGLAAMLFIQEYKVADTYVHVSINREGELVAEIHTGMRETITYDMYQIAAELQCRKHSNADKQVIDLLLMFLASGTTNRTRNAQMFAELAYYVSNTL